jgi:DNA-3-methyladenine glycosylase I
MGLFILEWGMKRRCAWAGTDPLYVAYHDREWGVPLHDDRKLFEMLILEGAQAGLSWITVLRKRESFREAFDRFDPSKVAGFDQERVRELLNNPGIIRNRLKIHAAVQNAQAFLNIAEKFGSFDRYLWQFVEGRPLQNRWGRGQDIPARTGESDALSKDLKKRGFKFVGSTICYAFMQAVGMVNDHLTTCFRHAEISRAGGERK